MRAVSRSWCGRGEGDGTDSSKMFLRFLDGWMMLALKAGTQSMGGSEYSRSHCFGVDLCPKPRLVEDVVR